MMVKKIIANSVGEAMELVKRDLGDEAIILNTRHVKVGGWFGLFAQKKVELVASVDENPSKEKKKERRPVVERPSRVNPERTQAVPKVISFSSRRLPEELQAYETILEEPALHNRAEQLHELLLSTFYKTNDPTQVQTEFLTAMEQEIQVTSVTSRYVLLTGPTGVGKTTTIAKLAAYYRLTEGKTVGLITTDTYRISAIEQLRTYAEIIDVPLHIAYNLSEFEQAKQQLADCDIVLIDTAGRNFLDEGYVTQLTARHDFADTDVFLVLSLTAKYRDLEQIRQRFTHVPLNGFIFTKADETTELWSIYGLAVEAKLPVLCITTGQEVPEDILWPSKADLSRMLMERGEQ
ncbi:GTP-binding protein [Exiguobacterium sp. s193]|uniref:flagellar biosynthesis protein FlhF n=1 Tax=Exiguobacterium sp. s193 TaxID=2751207 RepID=UPI001BEB6AA5|nr:GTP-binding protein [Exiguobacterium sp. s193]